ncbi:MAG TPA: rRNA maturation RNase YbeY [Candidatus Sulfotelmatobacter sp.]|nr:rRNA maturation RNase YbeY [Candidatus Sulfotelmatobacter sp.]
MVILQKKVAGLNEGTMARFVLRARKAVGLRAPVNVLVTSSAVVRSLNRQFRGDNKATDVLSFPYAPPAGHREKRKLAGDVAISADIARENSVRLGHPVAQEIKILALHGILHLAGFDHERDNGAMARKEAKLRLALRLPAALIERTHSAQPMPQPARPARFQPAKTQATKLRRNSPHAIGTRRMA